MSTTDRIVAMVWVRMGAGHSRFPVGNTGKRDVRSLLGPSCYAKSQYAASMLLGVKLDSAPEAQNDANLIIEPRLFDVPRTSTP